MGLYRHESQHLGLQTHMEVPEEEEEWEEQQEQQLLQQRQQLQEQQRQFAGASEKAFVRQRNASRPGTSGTRHWPPPPSVAQTRRRPRART